MEILQDFEITKKSRCGMDLEKFDEICNYEPWGSYPGSYAAILKIKMVMCKMCK
jgi:hypothetical protein